MAAQHRAGGEVLQRELGHCGVVTYVWFRRGGKGQQEGSASGTPGARAERDEQFAALASTRPPPHRLPPAHPPRPHSLTRAVGQKHHFLDHLVGLAHLQQQQQQRQEQRQEQRSAQAGAPSAALRPRGSHWIQTHTVHPSSPHLHPPRTHPTSRKLPPLTHTPHPLHRNHPQHPHPNPPAPTHHHHHHRTSAPLLPPGTCPHPAGRASRCRSQT